MNKPTDSNKMTYQNSGVDVVAGDALVDWLSSEDKPKMPHQDRVVSGIGGFASLFNFQFPEMKKPTLITCTDGVGTKVKLASQFNDYSTVGQDLVAMCVNDLVCTGGQPLLFLDYYATSKLDLNSAQQFLNSVRKACIESDCNLVGGETAEMPGVYHGNDFDCAGFAVGVVDQDKVLGPHKVSDGDVLIGVGSSGFHSNGFSLIRRLFEKDSSAYKKWLLEPTRLYVGMMKKLTSQFDIKAAAHITGGGIDNIPRVIPNGKSLRINSWNFTEPFIEAQKRSKLSDLEMMKTFNCGIGFVVIVRSEDEARVTTEIKGFGYAAQRIGLVVSENYGEDRYKVFKDGVAL